VTNPALSAENTAGLSKENNPASEKNLYVITADMLTVDSDDNSAEFNGNVKVTQGNMVITAHRILLLFQGDLAKENALKADEASIKEIIATDTVTIKLDNKIAMTNRAEYNTQKKVLILSGENTQIIMDENTITGNQITLYRNDGHIAVEGGQNERVKAIFYNGEEEMQ
jgi:lipopolysaccharide export system protein LptA